MQDVKQILSANMRRLRETAGITQFRLAEILGVEPPTVSRWESSANWPRPRDLEKMAATFKVSISELFNTNAEGAISEQMISKTQLLEMISSGKLPSSLLPPPAKPSPEEALAVLAEALEERRKLLESSRELKRNAPVDPKLSRLLSAIEAHPAILDIALNVASGFESAVNEGKPRAGSETG